MVAGGGRLRVLPMQKLIGVNDSSNTIQFNVSDSSLIVLSPSDPLDTYVNDEYVDAAVAAMVSGGMAAWRHVQVDPGEVVRPGKTDVTLSGTVADLGSADGLRGVYTVFVTVTGLLGCVLNGVSGGVDGREVDVVFKSNSGNVLNTLSLGHMAGGSTPAASRIFVGATLPISLGVGRRLKYHGSDSLWYVV